MPHAASYRRFHRLQHVDVLATLVLFAAIWLVWPEERRPRIPAPGDRIRIAYGEVDADSIGFLRYPGHFAFSSPIGFSSMDEPFAAGDPLWTVAGVSAFVEPLPPSGLPSSLPEMPPARLPSLAGLPSPPPWEQRPAPRERPPQAFQPSVRVERSPALEEREFHAALLPERLAALDHASGELQAFLGLSAEGRVASLVFLPSGFGWETLRPIEDALLRGVASAAPSASRGWLWIRWQNPDRPGNHPPPGP